jgi:hypothetical protein
MNKFYPNGITNVAEFTSHFLDKFGVYVKIEGSLVLYKYDMLTAKWAFPLTHFCRGSILKWDGYTWSQISNVWKKFFNLGEGYCPYFNVKDFAKNNSLSIVSKEDGTAIQVYFDGVKWRVSTLGTITPANVGDYNLTFDELFKKTLAVDWETFTKDLVVGTTYMFELCCSENRIVTKYATNRVFLLSVIDEHGVYADVGATEALAIKWNIYTPKRIMLYEYDITNKEMLVDWVEKNCPDEAEVQYKEGVVLYDGMTPVGKIKTANYLALHHVGGGDTAHSRNVIIDAFFAGTVDDIEKVLNDTLVAFLAKLRGWYSDKRSTLIKEAAEIAKGEYPTQKDFALRVQKIDDKRLASFFFANKEKVIAGAVDGDDISTFFKMGWSKFEKDIKELA